MLKVTEWLFDRMTGEPQRSYVSASQFIFYFANSFYRSNSLLIDLVSEVNKNNYSENVIKISILKELTEHNCAIKPYVNHSDLDQQ